MKKRTLAKVLGIAAGAGAAAGGATAAFSATLYNKVMGRPAKEWEISDVHDLQREGRAWAAAAEGFRPVTMRSSDGLTLWAWVIPGREGEHRWAICIHGYRDNGSSMGAAARHYADLGWNVLLPDQRCHGRSGGDHVGWGYEERLDVTGWVGYITRRDPDAAIVLHGVSMGAATVLMATGGALPRQVKAAVSDCAYTSIQEEMRHVLSRKVRKSMSIPMGVPFSALFAMLRRTALKRAGYDLLDADPLKAVGRSGTPTLFIHGAKDELVPPAMMGKLYQAARCPKDFLWLQDAGHAQSMGAEPERYWSKVDQFLHTYMA